MHNPLKNISTQKVTPSPLWIPQVDNRVKTETFCFSIKVMGFAIRYPSPSQCIVLFSANALFFVLLTWLGVLIEIRQTFLHHHHRCITIRVECRAFLKEHSDVGTFVDQHIAAGAYSHQLAQIYENYFGDDK